MTFTPDPLSPNEGEQLAVVDANSRYVEAEPRRRDRRRRRKGGIVRQITKRLGLRRQLNGVLIAIVSLVAISLIVFIALIVDSFTRINASINGLEQVLNAVQNRSGANISIKDFEDLQSGVVQVGNQLELAQNRLNIIRPFATANPDIELTFRSLDIARRLTDASEAMLSGLQPALFYLVAGEDENSNLTQISSGDRLVELLDVGREQFLKAQEQLAVAQTLLAELTIDNPPLELLRTTERIISFNEQLTSINDVLLNSTDLLNVVLGLNGQRTYLILAVNNDEIRPSGGFLSTWGWFTVRNGRMVDYDYGASTRTSPTPPDTSLANTFNIPYWWIQYRQPIYAAWDGSWSADFPSTASRAMWYYNEGGNEHAPIDGVLSVDITAFEYILGVLGEVEVANETADEVVTAANFREIVYDIRAYSTGAEPHKAFVAATYAAIMQEWQTASRDPELNSRILEALLRAVQEKHMMIYLANPQLDNAIQLLGWSGDQHEEANSDYLMVVDSNLGNKSNSSVLRNLTYDVDIQANDVLSKRLTIGYEYPASLADLDPAVDAEFHGPLDYSTMVQVYAPTNTELVSNSTDIMLPIVDAQSELWLASTSFVVPFDDSRRVQFSYTSPNLIPRFGNYGRYKLLIQKQPGTIGDTVTVQVLLPPNTKVVESNPAPVATFALDRPIVEYQFTLTVDQEIDLIFEYKPD